MLDNWLFVAAFVVVAVALPALPLIVARVLAPRKPNPQKQETYECGMETVGESWVQFKIQYYIYALVFLVFDVEIIFLYPWAVAFDRISLLGVVAGVLFIFLLGDGLVYAWRKGALEWS
jgi:NADH-quinone oxidoreductase subunit A